MNPLFGQALDIDRRLVEQYNLEHLYYGYGPDLVLGGTLNRGERKALNLAIEHSAELQDYGYSDIIPSTLGKLWRQEIKNTYGHDLRQPRVSFKTVFVGLASLVTPPDNESHYLFFWLLARFLSLHFDEMIQLSPETAYICLNALNGMGHPMKDMYRNLGGNLSWLTDMEDFPLPFAWQPEALEMLEGIRRSQLLSCSRNPLISTTLLDNVIPYPSRHLYTGRNQSRFGTPRVHWQSKYDSDRCQLNQMVGQGLLGLPSPSRSGYGGVRNPLQYWNRPMERLANPYTRNPLLLGS